MFKFTASAIHNIANNLTTSTLDSSDRSKFNQKREVAYQILVLTLEAWLEDKIDAGIFSLIGCTYLLK
jgi:hypothetical protein